MSIRVVFLFILICFSCQNIPEGTLIDLSDTSPAIYYSDFIDSVSYVKLNTNDSCLISEIEYMFVDSNYCIIKDQGGDGVFIFYQNQLIGHLNNFGRGPREFVKVSHLCIDRHFNQICIHDDISKKVLKYTYNGEFIKEYPFSAIIRDFTITDDKKFICIVPYYIPEVKCGVWLADSNGNYLKNLYEVSKNDQFNLSSVPSYFQCEDYLIYYDRYKDRIIKVNPDSTQVLFKFNLKQALPQKMKQDPSQDFVPGLFIECGFFYSERFMLLGFLSLDKHYWVLFDSKTGSVKVAEKIINDIDDRKINSGPFSYIGNHTFVTALQASENDCNIYLQLLHVKK